jgi:hypothetical protein
MLVDHLDHPRPSVVDQQAKRAVRWFDECVAVKITANARKGCDHEVVVQRNATYLDSAGGLI